MTQTLLNVAVIGCGYWGPNLIRNFNSLAGCRVKTLCDNSQDRLDYMKTMYREVTTTTDYQQIIHDPDIQAVVIAAPVHLHYEIAKKALDAGKHVLVEKPMARSTAECTDLIQLAAAKKLILMVGHTFVYSGPVRKIREIVEAGDLGKILYMSSRRLNLGLFQKDINVAWDLAPHDLSIMFYILQEDALTVNCVGSSNITKGIEDVTNLSITLKHNTFATIQSSWLDPNKVREITFVGTKRMLVYNDVEPVEKIKVYDKGVDTPPGYNSFAEFVYAYRNGDIYAPSLKMSEPLKVEAQHFLDCILTGNKPESSGEEGLRVVQVLEAASESLRQQGAQVAIKSS